MSNSYLTAQMSGSNKRSRDVLGDIISTAHKMACSLSEAKKVEANLDALGGNHPMGNGRGPTLATDFSEAPDGAITNFLQSMRDTIENRGTGANIEVELRFGKITSNASQQRFAPRVPGDACIVLYEDDIRKEGAKFIPGVRQPDFEAFKHKVMKLTTQTDAFAKQEEQQRVSTFPGSRRVIEEVDLNTETTMAPYLQVKERLGSINMFLPHCPYDIRVSISLEFPGTTDGLDMLPSPDHMRHKKRVSAVGREVRVDLTEVSENQSNHQGQGQGQASSTPTTTFEVELELQASVVQEWLALSDSQSWKGAVVSATILWHTVTRYFSKNAGQAFKQTWDGMAAPAHELQNAYMRHFDHHNKFPGRKGQTFMGNIVMMTRFMIRNIYIYIWG
jgi:hypothetical protein